MTTAVIQIGNSDDKLTQHEWSMFVRITDDLIAMFADERHFHAPSPGHTPWQNACWIFTIDPAALDQLRDKLAIQAKRFRQDSIALTVGDTEFVEAEP